MGRVFVDTNVIIEAFRLNCWRAVATHYTVETVEACVTEARTGDTGRVGRVEVPDDVLRAGLAAQHRVTARHRAGLITAHPACRALDDGERDLFAWLLSQPQPLSSSVLVTTADKAAIVASLSLAWLDHLISLEALLKGAGAPAPALSGLRSQFREQWLTEIRTKVRLGVLP